MGRLPVLGTLGLLLLSACGTDPSPAAGAVVLDLAFPNGAPGVAVNLVVAVGGDSVAPPFQLLLRGEGDGLETGEPVPGTYPASGIADEAKILVTASNVRWTGFAVAGTVTLAAVAGGELEGRVDILLARRIGGTAIPDLPVTGSFVARRTSDLP
jgi:hypothetical protein